MKGKKIAISTNSICVMILLIIPALKWFFRGISSRGILIEAVLLALGIMICLKLSISRDSLIWLGFIAPIVLRILYTRSEDRKSSFCILFIILTLYIIVADIDKDSLLKGMAFIKYYGLLVASTVIIQYSNSNIFLKNVYNHLNNSDEVIEKYGYYMSRYYNSGIFYEPHDSACYIGVALGIIIIEILLNINKYINLGLMVFLVFCLILTQKKGILIATACAIIAIILSQYRKNRNIGKIVLFAIAIPILVVFSIRSIMAAQNTIVFLRMQRFLRLFFSGNESDFGRLKIYRDAIILWKEHPVLGIGWKNYITLSQQRFHYSIPHEVNCDYLQMLCENGIIGFVLCMIPIVVTAIRSFSIEKSRLVLSYDINDQRIIMYSFYVQILILLYAIVEVPFYDETFFSIYIFSCLIIKWIMQSMYIDHRDNIIDEDCGLNMV